MQREIVNYAHLTRHIGRIKTIIETTFRSAHRATSPWVDSKRAPKAGGVSF